jgi:membrane fusion protein, heavy metal efflux system
LVLGTILAKRFVPFLLITPLLTPAFTASIAAPPAVEIVASLAAEQIHAAGIETQLVEPQPGVGETVLPGVVTVPPQQLRIVAAPAGGLVETLLVAPDEDAKEGEPLATLKSSELVVAQRGFLHAVSEADLQAEKLRRDEQLFREHIIAERRLIVTRAEASQAHARLDERAQILSLAGMTDSEIAALGKDRKLASSPLVRAPIGGTILQRHGTTGEHVAASAPLVTIARLDLIWVNLQVALSRTTVAFDGDERVHLVSAGLDGKLIRLGHTAGSATQSVTAVAEFPPGRSPLRPSQAVQAILRVKGGGVSQWRVPADAVVSHRNFNWVFLRVPEGFRAIPVTRVSETPQYASVQGALKAGEKVATRGLLTLLAELAEIESK